MRYIIGTNYKACTIAVSVKATAACVIWIEAYDSKLPDTYYTRRFYELTAGQLQTIYIQIPLCGKFTYVEVYEHEKQYQPLSSLTIVSIKKMPLAAQMDVVNMQDSKIRHFVRFAQRFAFNAAVLTTYDNRYYVSDSEGFKIKYIPLIFEEGKEVITPARILIDSQVIEVSKVRMLPLTVPARFCILCHEFSHLFVNDNMYNELEADLNGLIIYLGLGYPRVEAKDIFSSIKELAPSNENEYRFAQITDFIDKFDTLNFEHL